MDGVASQLPDFGAGLAVTQDVGEHFVGIAPHKGAYPAFSHINSYSSIQWNTVELQPVDEPPVCKLGEAVAGEEVIAGIPPAGQLEGLALVQLPFHVFDIVAVEGILQDPLQLGSVCPGDDNAPPGVVWSIPE